MIGWFKPKMPPEFAQFAARHVRMAVALCETYADEHTLVRINPQLTPRFDDPQSQAKLVEAFDYFENFSQRLVNMLPSEKRAAIEEFITEFSTEPDDEDSAYYFAAALFLLHMVHLETILTFRKAYRGATELWTSVDLAAELMCTTYLIATQGKESSAPSIVPILFRHTGLASGGDA
ncbi:MAG: hypothetical protein KF800_00785 [Lysobacter sp.]|nr:hypothetical protein [Lysobacter sp.]